MPHSSAFLKQETQQNNSCIKLKACINTNELKTNFPSILVVTTKTDLIIII